MHLKRSISIPFENAQRSITEVADHQVGLAIAVNISDCDRRGPFAGLVVHLWRKGSIPSTEKNTHRVIGEVSDHQVEGAVMIEIASCGAVWICAHGKLDRFEEARLRNRRRASRKSADKTLSRGKQGLLRR